MIHHHHHHQRCKHNNNRHTQQHTHKTAASSIVLFGFSCQRNRMEQPQKQHDPPPVSHSTHRSFVPVGSGCHARAERKMTVPSVRLSSQDCSASFGRHFDIRKSSFHCSSGRVSVACLLACSFVCLSVARRFHTLCRHGTTARHGTSLSSSLSSSCCCRGGGVCLSC